MILADNTASNQHDAIANYVRLIRGGQQQMCENDENQLPSDMVQTSCTYPQATVKWSV